MAKRKNITTTQLALMTAAAVISLRGLPMMAQEELTMFFYIFFATFLFLIPAALVGAELGSAFASKGGGVYTWVKEAFNKHLGFTAIFLQWIQNVVWYPTVLGFAAASIAYMIGMPGLAQNGLFVGLFSIAMYWCATLVTLRGTSAISGITSKGFLIGTVLPGIVVIVMAVIWMAGGNPRRTGAHPRHRQPGRQYRRGAPRASAPLPAHHGHERHRIPGRDTAALRRRRGTRRTCPGAR